MNLKVKFSLLTFLSIFLSLCIASAVLANRSIVQLKANLIERDILVSEKMLPVLLSDFGNYYTYQYATYLSAVKRELALYPDLTYFRIINTQSEDLFETSDITKNFSQAKDPEEVKDPVITQVINSRKTYQDVVTVGNEKTIRIIVPYIDNFDAYRNLVEFHFSLDAVTREVRETLIFFVVLLFFLTTTFVLVSIYFVDKFTKPLLLLKNASVKMSKGEFSDAVTVNTEDEVGILALAFNDMSRKLQRSYAALSEKVVELGNEKAKLTSAIVGLPAAFMILDIESKIILQNGRLDSIFGPQMVPWTIEFIDTLLGEGLNLGDMNSRVLREKKVFDIDDVQVGAKFLSIYIGPIISSENKIIGSVVTIKDSTESRTFARSKDEFFTIASHELRTPLTAIKGNSALILDIYGKEIEALTIKPMVDDIHNASVQLIGLVNEFLEMSRLEQHKETYNLTDFKILPVIEGVAKNLKAIADKSNVVISVKCSPDTTVKADPNKLSQVLVNLVGNSLKFTKDGTVEIKVIRSDNKTHILITDTGEGISLANQSLLFHKFQQAGSSLTNRDTAKGTGLGLYISRMITEDMGGKLTLVKSDQGKGSVFEIIL